MSKRIRIYAKEDIAEHTSPASCWVTRNGKVYDVTGFLADHPGGEEYILRYAGKDIDEVMKDATEHDHSDAAYDMLHDFFIGRVGHGENTVSDGESSNHSGVRLSLTKPRLEPGQLCPRRDRDFQRL